MDQMTNDFTNPLFQQAFKQYFAELGITVKDWDGLFQEMKEDLDTYALLRTNGQGSLIGFLMFKPTKFTSWFFEETCGFIREFFIFPEFRGSGHGTDLLSAAESYFLQHGMYTSILTTDTAPDFYIHNGYQRAHLPVIIWYVLHLVFQGGISTPKSDRFHARSIICPYNQEWYRT